MKIGYFSLNWFDLVVVAVWTVGLWRGRKRGISVEILDVLRWLVVIVVCTLYYRPMGRLFAAYTNLGLLPAFILAYLFLLSLIALGFSWLKRMVGEKLVSGDLFGKSEYYLGMVGGVVRFSCMLLAALAILHAKEITSEQRAAQDKMQKDNFGDISFPTFASVQYDVFYGSLSGRFVRTHLSDQLISGTTPGKKPGGLEAMRARRQREFDELFPSKN